MIVIVLCAIMVLFIFAPSYLTVLIETREVSLRSRQYPGAKTCSQRFLYTTYIGFTYAAYRRGIEKPCAEDLRVFQVYFFTHNGGKNQMIE